MQNLVDSPPRSREILDYRIGQCDLRQFEFEHRPEVVETPHVRFLLEGGDVGPFRLQFGNGIIQGVGPRTERLRRTIPGDIDPHISRALGVEVEKLGDIGLHTAKCHGNIVLEDERRNVGDVGRSLAVSVLDDRAFAHLGDREFDETPVLADRLGKDILSFERGFHDFPVHQVVSRRIDTRDVFATRRTVVIIDADIGIADALGFENFDAGPVLLDQADRRGELVTEVIILIEDDCIGKF